MRQWVKILLGILVVIAIILAIVLPLSAQKTLESTEVGLNYNPTTKGLDEDEVFKQGRHTIGVANYFIKFPTDIKAITFEDVRTRTNDGLIINLSVSFQYRYKVSKEDLVELFYNFGEEQKTHEEHYRLFCRNVFRDVTSNYNAYDFITKRNNIQQDLSQSTAEILDKYGANVENFQLLNANFPGQFQETIDGAQQARLEIKNVENQQKQIEQDVKGRIEQANIDKKTIENEAETEALAIIGRGTQKKEQSEARIKNKIDGSVELIKTLQMTPPDLIKYTWNSGIGLLASRQENSIQYRPRIPAFISNLNP